MIFREAIEQISGLRHLSEGLELSSALARRVLGGSSMMTLPEDIERELRLVERTVAMFADAAQANALSAITMRLTQIKELRGTASRLTARRTLDDVELFELKVFAMTVVAVNGLAEGAHIDLVALPDVGGVVALLDPDGTNIPHFSIYDAYSPELAEVRRRIKTAKQKGGDEARTAELYTENARLEDEVRVRLSADLSAFAPIVEEAMAAVAHLDLLIAKARQADRLGLCRPQVAGLTTGRAANNAADNTTTYRALFNPAVMDALRDRGKDFQPVDITLTEGPTVITGANMGGKTVLLKSVALAQAMFQFGFYTPAQKAEIAPVEEILTGIGDGQDEMSGLSSFAAEMVRLNEIITHIRAGRRALVLLDEPARTTNPTEGEAIVNALVELLAEHRVRSLVTSHYGGIRTDVPRLRVKGFAQTRAQAQNAQNTETHGITAANIQDHMDYSLVPDDGHPPREALRIARILGVDEELVARAEKEIKREEKHERI